MPKFVRKSFVKTIVADDTAEALTASAIGVEEFTIQADSGNSNPIYMGDSAVDDTKGLEMLATFTHTSYKSVTLGDIYVYGKIGDKVRVFYTQRS